MAMRIAIASPKGGVGKTTVALNLALALADKGRSTLLVDLDPQGGIGHALAKGDTALAGLAERLAVGGTAAASVVVTKQKTLAILPRGKLHPADAPAFEAALASGGVLDTVLREAEGEREFTVIDTPSGMGSATRAAFSVADFVLVPVQVEPLALRSVTQVLQVLEHVRATENPRLQLLGMLPTMVDRTKPPLMDVLVTLWTEFGTVLDTNIPRDDAFAEASHRGIPVGYLAGAKPMAARRMEQLAGEVLELVTRLSAKEGTADDRAERQLL